MNERDQILILIQNHKINFHRIVKKDLILSLWVEENKIDSYSSYAQEIYSALYKKKPEICERGNLAKWQGMQKGWQFCGKNYECSCLKEWQGKHSEFKQSEKTIEQKIETNLVRENTIAKMTDGKFTNVMQIPDVKKVFSESYKEKTGYDWPLLNPTVKEKIGDAVEARFGEGIRNPFNDDQVQARIRYKRLQLSDEDKLEIKIKLRKTREGNGYGVSAINQTPFAIYTKIARTLTEKSYKDKFNTINPEKLNRKEYHLDRIYSILSGFNNNIPPYIIGHWTNLRMLLAQDNVKKSSRCDKTREQLFEDFFSNQ